MTKAEEYLNKAKEKYAEGERFRKLADSRFKSSDDGLSVKTQRSMIHPQYASRFIRQYLIDLESD